MPNTVFIRPKARFTLCFCTVILAFGGVFSVQAKPGNPGTYMAPEDNSSIPSSVSSATATADTTAEAPQFFDEATRYQHRRDKHLHDIAYDDLPQTDKLNDAPSAQPFVASPRYVQPLAAPVTAQITPAAPPVVRLMPPTVTPLTAPAATATIANLTPASGGQAPAMMALPVQEVPAAPAIAQQANIPAGMPIPDASLPDTNPMMKADMTPRESAPAKATPETVTVITSPPLTKSIVHVPVIEATDKPVVVPADMSKSAITTLNEQQKAAAAQNEKSLAALAPSSGGPAPFSSDDPIIKPAIGPSVAPAVLMPAKDIPPGGASSEIVPPADKLTQSSKSIADKLPAEKIPPVKTKQMVSVEHFRKSALEDQADVKQHEGVGIKISVKNQKANVTQMLENAYDALIAGNQDEAITLYKEALEEQPNNRLALFGLATTYHRAGQLQLARPLYGKLLAIDPDNKEGLNNFLVLLSDESPNEALVELGKLEQSHPGFSPVPAQMALIYEKSGNYVKAIEMMNKAIEMSPANLKYRYDMAIMLDKQGAWKDAATLYLQLIAASERGEKIPAAAEEIQERLTFIRSNRPKA